MNAKTAKKRALQSRPDTNVVEFFTTAEGVPVWFLGCHYTTPSGGDSTRHYGSSTKGWAEAVTHLEALKADEDPPIEFVRCTECGHEQPDMGKGVACEECRGMVAPIGEGV